MTRLVALAALLAALLLVSCVPTKTTLEGTACPAGMAALDLGGCCSDADSDGICDASRPAQPSENQTQEPAANITEPIVTETNPANGTNATAPVDLVSRYKKLYDQRVRTYTYYLDTPYYDRLWIWQDAQRIRYISAGRLFEVRRNRINGSQYTYSKHDNNIIYPIQDRSLALVNYVEYNRSTTSYDACYVQNPRYSLNNCIRDYPNNNVISYGGIKYTPPRDPVTWLFSFAGRKPARVVPDKRFHDVDGSLSDAEEVTFTQQNGDTITFLVNTAYGAPLRVTVVDRWGKPKESLILEGVAFNSQYTIDGDPRLEPQYEYR